MTDRLARRLVTMLAICCILLPVPAGAQEAPLAAPPPQPLNRSYLVYASGLTISPQDGLTTMLFSGGVRIEGRGLNLYTDTLELTLVGDALPLGDDIELPEGEIPSLPDVLENRESGEDLAQAARELELPTASFQSDSVRRLKATGNVRFEGHGVVISTQSVQSSDGGLNWQGSGRTTLSMDDANGSTVLSADGIHLDSVNSIVTARGHISGSYRQLGVEQALKLETEGCRFDMQRGIVTVPGEVRLSYDAINMLISPLAVDAAAPASVARELDPLVPQGSSTPELAEAPPGVSIDLENRLVRARGNVHVSDPRRGIELDALNLDYLMDGGLMKAWQVELSDIGHGMTLSAPLVEIFTNEKRLEASGMPVLRYQNSSYTGERIIVSEEADDLLVIEIEGQQLATLHMDELRMFGDDDEDGIAVQSAAEVTISSEKSSSP